MPCLFLDLVWDLSLSHTKSRRLLVAFICGHLSFNISMAVVQEMFLLRYAVPDPD